MMIEREADQSRGERESPRAMTPEVVAARIVLRVAERRLLAAWASTTLADFERHGIPKSVFL